LLEQMVLQIHTLQLYVQAAVVVQAVLVELAQHQMLDQVHLILVLHMQVVVLEVTQLQLSLVAQVAVVLQDLMQMELQVQ
jgi:hypothetical protein